MRKVLWASPLLLLGMFAVRAAEVDTVPPGTQVTVRTDEPIQIQNWDRGRVYRGEVAQDVYATDGDLAIPRGAPAELTVREIGPNDMAVDLDSVTVNGRRFVVSTTGRSYNQRYGGIGTNQRTAKYVGGGALLGTIIGAIAGGGKGAAIGAAVGAAGGAGAQVLTRGREINVPAESMLTFRLDRPLRYVEGADNGYQRNGYHYHQYQDLRQYPDNYQNNNGSQGERDRRRNPDDRYPNNQYPPDNH